MITIQELHEELTGVQADLAQITVDREKDAKAQEELELDQDPTEKLKSGSPKKPTTDKYTEQERKLKERERRLLEKAEVVVRGQAKRLEADHEYKMYVRKSMAGERADDIGDLKGKGYVDMAKRGERTLYTDRLPEISQNFETINTLPRIASKYKKTDRGFSLEKMTQRDPNALIKPSFGALLSPELQGFRPHVKGQVAFAKMNSRKPLLAEKGKQAPDVYSYAESLGHALAKGKSKKTMP